MGESARKLKIKAKTMAIQNNVTVQEVIQSYMFERILVRICSSPYHDNFILKGGVLLSSISGIQSRTTMDMDTMIEGLDFESECLKKVLEEILGLDVDDGIRFEIIKIEDIRSDDNYGGFRFMINGILDNIKNHLSIDVSTGDIITPNGVFYRYKMLFNDNTILIKSYNIETILAEKFQTVLESNGFKGRMKDYYDIWYFVKRSLDDIDFDILNKAINNTFTQRDCLSDLIRVNEILSLIKDSSILRKRWNEYSSKHSYSKDISFENIMDALYEFSNKY